MKRTLACSAQLCLVITAACSDDESTEEPASDAAAQSATASSPEATQTPATVDDAAVTSAAPAEDPAESVPPEPTRLPADSEPDLVGPVWSIEAEVASTPRVVDGVVLANLVADEHGLQATAWDLESGDELTSPTPTRSMSSETSYAST